MVDEGEFESFIEEVDSEDGLVDGKLAVDPKTGKLVYGYQPNQLSIAVSYTHLTLPTILLV